MNAAVWFYLATTLVALVWLSWHYALAVTSTRWPHVRAEVRRVWVERADDEYSYYSPRVEYAYKVDAILHTSSTIWLSGDKSMRRSRAGESRLVTRPGIPWRCGMTRRSRCARRSGQAAPVGRWQAL